MSEIREFKSKSKRVLDLMINLIYTSHEIFLRELISNASDSLNNHYLLSLTDDRLSRDVDYEILIIPDKTKRTLTISDNGFGMTYDELIDSLGTIAKSGPKEFLEKLADENKEVDVNII